jgi:hypothetical protein
MGPNEIKRLRSCSMKGREKTEKEEVGGRENGRDEEEGREVEDVDDEMVVVVDAGRRGR